MVTVLNQNMVDRRNQVDIGGGGKDKGSFSNEICLSRIRDKGPEDMESAGGFVEGELCRYMGWELESLCTDL